jgi:succinate dehydrogenase/fumarate reductase flavoprotein subunit
MGNALVARLLYSLARRGVPLALETTLEKLHVDGDGVHAVTLAQRGERRTVRVRGGVVLASGGFNRHPMYRASLLPGIDARWCPGAPGHTGEAQAQAIAAGARHGDGAMSHAFWAPVSLRKRTDGTTAVFPHFLMDRGKPGFLAVNRAGRRFVNESTSYHLFALAMQDAHRTSPSIPAYLVADAEAVRKYGIGIVRPGGRGLAPFLADGYLTAGATLRELALKLSIDPAALEATVARFNAFASAGVDEDFARGTTAYQRNLGDAASRLPNPCLGPLIVPPFYAVRLYPGDIGAATGLVCDEDARVLDAHDRPIPGLYAAGNDMHSVMGGVYTAPGITLGPGVVFAYLAARHAALRASGAAATAAHRPAALAG